MVYASSRDALRKSLTGIHIDIQGTDKDEVSYETSAYSPAYYPSSIHNVFTQHSAEPISPARYAEESNACFISSIALYYFVSKYAFHSPHDDNALITNNQLIFRPIS